MANTYADATGVLIFNGPSRITPVIRMLFSPFKLDEEPESSGSEHYVAVLSEECNPDWDHYIDDVIDAAERDFGLAFEEGIEFAYVLRAIGAHFNADLDSLIASIDFDNSVLLSDLVALALLLKDGHNLVGLSLEGCWHCDKPRLWEFGGWSTYASSRYILALSTADISVFARAMDAHTAEGVDATAKSLHAFVQALIDGIVDERLQKQVVPRLADLLSQKPLARGKPETSDEPTAWQRTVYVEAYATDDGAGPGYARLEVTPGFIETLKSLRTLCSERNLTEVRIADAPDAWGSGTSEEPLRLLSPELVVTPRMFWFVDIPKGLEVRIETRGLDIERFIY
ncbi:MAG: hypothetical protein OSA97_12885, partial [Nevskia sp.]|nr:hypothetical protein [Nevskia sp.]